MKTLTAQAAEHYSRHPNWFADDIEAGLRFSMFRGMLRETDRYGCVTYHYRGTEIHKSEDDGRVEWRAGKQYFDSCSEARVWIDRKIACVASGS